jgi:hypothetical protein
MFQHRILVAWLLALTCLFSWLPQGNAYVVLKDYNGNESKWSASTIKWYLHPSGSNDVSFSELQNAMNAMFQEFQNISCFTKNFSYGGTKNYDPENGIYIKFQENSWDATVGDAAAYAQSWKGWGGKITNSVIVYNGKDITWTTTEADDYFSAKSDIQGVGTHELGHCMGLDHSRLQEATMFFSGGSEEMRTLEQDDKNGICYLYSSFTSGKPCDSCSSDNNCQSGYCLQYPGGGDFCGKNCSSDSNCASDFYCYDVSSGTDQCVPNNGYCDQQGANIPIGQFCYGHETCQSSLCLALPGNAYCSKECSQDSQCPGAMKCIGDYCIQGGSTAMGGSCQSHMDCQSSMCMGISASEGVCTQECKEQYDCPDGFSCVGGYCYQGGGKSYGQPCEEYDECESLYCKSAGALTDPFCTYQCENKYDCPDYDPCTYGICIPPGPGGFGEQCDQHPDCQTGLCKGSGGSKYCTMFCDSDGDCPLDTDCGSGGYCDKPAQVTTFCESDADCVSSEFCKALSPLDETATCVEQCNPFADSGCSPGTACQWFYKSWTDSIYGECVKNNSGGAKGDSCDPLDDPCMLYLVCINVGGTGATCFSDCNSQTGLGCGADESCLNLGVPDDPHHGVCVCNGMSCGETPKPDITEQPVEDSYSEPDLYQPQPDVWSQPDTGTPWQSDTGKPSNQDEDTFGWTWDPNNTPGDPGGGGCSQGATPSGLALFLLVGLIGLLWVRRWTRSSAQNPS